MSEPDILREADQIPGVALPEFGELVGHDETFFGLQQAVARGRPPSGVLLAGPRGIGKATLAFALAREVLVATGDESRERVAAQVAAMSHPNMFVLRRARDASSSVPKFFSAIRVEDVRGTRESLQRTRGRTGFRVCIVDAVDDCNLNSANALLKTLEEPPPETLFIVISHRPGGLLPTIRSRCQSHALRPIDDDAVRTVVTASGLARDTDALDRAVMLAQGRPRRGFEALVLAEGELLDGLSRWLADPVQPPVRAQLAIADALAASKGAELGLAEDMLRDWTAEEARAAARDGQGRLRLASANQLWDKANALLADADIYNLDRRQTLVAVFDAIRDHLRKTLASS